MNEIEQHELTFPGQRVTQHRRRRGIYILPSFFTVGNLLCGYYAILAILTGGEGHMDNAAKAIGVAILFDAFDGFVARLAGATSEFGKQFDSLADVISFGIAPAALAYAWGVRSLNGDLSSPAHAVQEIAWLVCLAFAICCAWRLARFNVQGMSSGSGMRYFVGMPTPAAAGAIAATVHFLKEPLESWHFSAAFLIAVALLAALMTSTVRYPSLKNVNWGRRHDSLTIVLIGLFAWCVIAYSQYTLILLASAYCISGPIIYVVRAIRHRVSPPSNA
ncbi:MAG TPA: CDP-diacylglycerol--serine O-phosphatidyltransferase [Candidatus Acidoferrales bacterium]|jgi:CDP-diacylglycerol--serine O-phosphatidyltransferase|nr:CDP-diacylglycerol--serine O-phosphatidyltransferase [Candidatus Acidoferrales bacterium]